MGRGRAEEGVMAAAAGVVIVGAALGLLKGWGETDGIREGRDWADVDAGEGASVAAGIRGAVATAACTVGA